MEEFWVLVECASIWCYILRCAHLKATLVHSHYGYCPIAYKRSVSLEERRVTSPDAPSLSPGFSCFSGTRGQGTGLTQFWPFDIFFLAGYNQSTTLHFQKLLWLSSLPKGTETNHSRVLKIEHIWFIRTLLIGLLLSEQAFEVRPC